MDSSSQPSNPSPNPTEKPPVIEPYIKDSSNGARIWACTWRGSDKLITGDTDGLIKEWDLSPKSISPVEKPVPERVSKRLRNAEMKREEESNRKEERNKAFEDNKLMAVERKNEEDGPKAIVSVAIDPDGGILAASALDGSVRLYRFSDKKKFTIVTRVKKKSEDIIRQLQFSPKGAVEYLAGAQGSKGIKLWKKNNECWSSKKEAHAINLTADGIDNKNYVLSLAWNCKGTQVACGSKSGYIYLFDAPDFEPTYSIDVRPTPICPTPIRTLAYSPSQEHILVSGSDDGKIRVHNTTNNCEVISMMEGHSHWVLTVDVSPRGDIVASGSSDGTMKLWDRETGGLIRSTTQDNWVRGVKFKAVNDKPVSVLATVDNNGSISYTSILEYDCYLRR